ncbi:hypothetical protein [Limnohabitans sp.]
MNRQQLQTRHFRQLGAFLSCWGATTVVWSQSVEGAREAHTPVLIQSTALEYRQFEKVEITGSSIVRKEQTQALPVLSVT